MTLIIGDHFFSGARRIYEAAANSPDRFTHGLGIQIQKMLDEDIGMNGLNPIGLDLTRFRGHPKVRLEAFTMADKSVRYTQEFKRQMVELARTGRSPASLAKEFGPPHGRSLCGSSRTPATAAKAMAA